jgi:AraC family transcriptional regulator of adaptative response / DNA-3-methyladenine glycosylase II
MLAFFAGRAITGVEVVETNRYARTIEVDGLAGTIVVSPSTSKANALTLTIRFPEVAALPTIVSRVRRMFDLDADLRVIHAALTRDPLLARLIATRPGLRVPGAWSPFELVVRAILGQQVSVSVARGLLGRLAARRGAPLDGEAREHGLTHVFPRADVLRTADFAELGVPRARAAALASCARVVADTKGLFDATRPFEETLAVLGEVSGIGEWTLEYVALRALRDPDAFPASDLGLLRSAAAGGARPTPAALRARAESWRPWRAYAAQHLWCADGTSLGNSHGHFLAARRGGLMGHGSRASRFGDARSLDHRRTRSGV